MEKPHILSRPRQYRARKRIAGNRGAFTGTFTNKVKKPGPNDRVSTLNGLPRSACFEVNMKTARLLNRKTILKSFLIITAIWIIAPPISAWAHKVTVFAWVEGDTVFTESKFSGGRRVRDGRIEVYDLAIDKKLLEGRTNSDGEYSFKIPLKTDMKIVLEAGMGHRAEWTLMRDEFEDAPDINTQADAAMQTAGNSDRDGVMPVQAVPVTDCADIEATMEKVLDKKLKPLIRKLNHLEHRDDDPAITDILGGLGYILGLIGIAAYVHSRRREK